MNKTTVAQQDKTTRFLPHAQGILQRKCACGNHTARGGECEECAKKKIGLQRKLTIGASNDPLEREADRVADQVMASPARSVKCAPLHIQRYSRQAAEASMTAPASVDRVLAGTGSSLEPTLRQDMEQRFGYDFSHVRVHSGTAAEQSAREVNANAYTAGHNIVFGANQFAPGTQEGRWLVAHELTHVVQQSRADKSHLDQRSEKLGLSSIILESSLPAVLARAPAFPDSTCDGVRDNITAAWPTARQWVRNAESRLTDPQRVASALHSHFKIDPNNSTHASDLQTVRSNLNTMVGIFDQNIDQLCTPAGQDDECHLPDGRRYAAYVTTALPNTITHCLTSAERGFLTRESLINTIVHEVAHLVDPSIDDYAYRNQSIVTTYTAMTRQQAIHNADSYSEFCLELFGGPATITPILLGVGTGVLLSTGRPRWAITASYDIRSRSGIEVFDLVGGLSGFIALDVAPSMGEPVVRDYGAELNLGFISRSAETQFFVDTRLGAFFRGDVASEQPIGAGMSLDMLIGWGDSRFRTGINVRALFDFLRQNHAVIIGGEFQFGP